MKEELAYWRKRAELAEAVIGENQIGAWKRWKDHIKHEPNEHVVSIESSPVCNEIKECDYDDNY